MSRQKRGFKDHKDPTEGLKNQLKMETGNEYIVKFPADILEQWEEVWPTFKGADGRITRRFVSDEDGANLKPFHQYKKEVGIPADIDKNDAENWKVKGRYGSIVLIGTEQTVKVDGKKRKKITWDKENPKVWLFGISVFRQLCAINNNVDLQETMEEKGHSTENFNCTDVYYFRVSKTKKGSENWQVEYTVAPGKPIGQFKKGAIDLEEIEKEFYDFIEPTKDSDLAEYLEQSGESSGDEPESVEEEITPDEETVEPEGDEDDLDIPELDEDPEPEPKKGKGKGKGKKKAEPETEPDDEPEESSDDNDELDLDDIDGLLDD